MKINSVIVCLAAVWLFLVCGPAGLWAGESGGSGLTLDQAYARALENNNQVRSSKEQVQQARQEVGISTSQLLPQVNARAEYTRQKTFSFISPVDKFGLLSVSASQHLYQGGKIWSQRRASQYSLQSQEFRHFRRLQSVLFNVATQYYEVLLANQNIVIAENQLRRTKRQLERAEQRLEVGLVNRTAVLRAEVQVARSREQLERARNQRAVALENLRLEMGVSELPEKLEGIQEQRLEDSSPDTLQARGFSNRRDLQQLAGSRQAAEETVQAEKGDFWPRLSLEGAYSRTNEEELYFGERTDWNVSVVASYPLFTGFRDVSEVNRAQRRTAEIRADFRRLKRSISAEIRSVYLDLKTQEKVIMSLEEEVDSAKANYEQIVAQFNEGLVSAVDVVDAQTALNEAERRLSLAFFNYQLNLLRLELATGTYEQERVRRHLLVSWNTDALRPEGGGQ
mgnify:CR=1 FL=1